MMMKIVITEVQEMAFLKMIYNWKLFWDRINFVFFAYSTWAMPIYIQGHFPNVTIIGVGKLPYHRLDFDYSLDESKGSLPKIVPDCGYEVWGAIYTISIQNLDLVLSKSNWTGNENTAYHSTQKIIETYDSGENLINLKCNAFQQNVPPEKLIYGLDVPQDRRPLRRTLDRMIKAFNDASLPEKYIEQDLSIPTQN